MCASTWNSSGKPAQLASSCDRAPAACCGFAFDAGSASGCIVQESERDVVAYEVGRRAFCTYAPRSTQELERLPAPGDGCGCREKARPVVDATLPGRKWLLLPCKPWHPSDTGRFPQRVTHYSRRAHRSLGYNELAIDCGAWARAPSAAIEALVVLDNNKASPSSRLNATWEGEQEARDIQRAWGAQLGSSATSLPLLAVDPWNWREPFRAL